MAKTVIKRVGGKIKIRQWIKDHLPIHDLYCEPFGGSFAVGFLMPKPNATYRLIYNDLDKNVYNFFKVLRDNKKEFIEKVELSPYSREEFNKSIEYIENKHFLQDNNPVEWARNYLIYNRQSMFGKEDGTWCVSRTGENICLSWAKLPPFIDECADFFKNIYIENLDFSLIFKKWDCEEALFYIDPPYKNVEDKFYHVNKENGFDHKDLFEKVKTLKGSYAISYYDSPFIRDMYKESDGFCFYENKVVKHMQTKKIKDTETELLIVKKNEWSKSKENLDMCF